MPGGPGGATDVVHLQPHAGREHQNSIPSTTNYQAPFLRVSQHIEECLLRERSLTNPNIKRVEQPTPGHLGRENAAVFQGEGKPRGGPEQVGCSPVSKLKVDSFVVDSHQIGAGPRLQYHPEGNSDDGDSKRQAGDRDQEGPSGRIVKYPAGRYRKSNETDAENDPGHDSAKSPKTGQLRAEFVDIVERLPPSGVHCSVTQHIMRDRPRHLPRQSLLAARTRPQMFPTRATCHTSSNRTQLDLRRTRQEPRP